jgi:hypothetical protein
MLARCPNCNFPVEETWHRTYGVEKIDRGWVEVGVPMLGRVNIKKESVVMVYICELTRLPFLVVLKTAR